MRKSQFSNNSVWNYILKVTLFFRTCFKNCLVANLNFTKCQRNKDQKASSGCWCLLSARMKTSPLVNGTVSGPIVVRCLQYRGIGVKHFSFKKRAFTISASYDHVAIKCYNLTNVAVKVPNNAIKFTKVNSQTLEHSEITPWSAFLVAKCPKSWKFWLFWPILIRFIENVTLDCPKENGFCC